jgi:acyl-CoA oxidase
MTPIDPALRHLAPLLYVAWADGALGPTEITRIRELARIDRRLSAATRSELEDWLDPLAPPDAARLNALREQIRTHARDLPAGARESLVEMGVAIAAIGDGAPAVSPEERAALRDLEHALGVPPHEAARALLPREPEPARPAAEPALDAHALHRFIDRDHFDIRQRVLALLSTPDFRRVDARDHDAYRARVLDWCRRLADEGLGAIAYPREFGGEADVARSIAVFETIAYHDLSLLVKFGVQFGLFAGSIYRLGTRSHHERFLRAAVTLELPGCFAMTETAHGSNVRDLETTATFDAASKQFVIRTPSERARKDYIGNAALHGRMAVVFAQLATRGEAQGVHAFLVPLRDDRGALLPGVRIEDCGPKEGLNGIDNGRIAFDEVRIPRENLLDRFGSVAEDGSYSSPIGSQARRFFTMIGTLVAGRVSIAAAAMNACKTGLTIAVRYADRRRQFGPEGRPEVPILDYLAVQRHLLPRIAATYALDFALKDLIRRYAAGGTEAAREVEAQAAGLKAFSSRHTVDTLQLCREACGGQGYLTVNRLPALMADTDVFTTFEGANDVLLQLVAKGLLTEYHEEFGELRLWGALRWLAGRAATALVELNPVVTRRTEPGHLRDPEFLTAALRYREERLLLGLARRLRRRIEEGLDSFAALNACQDHAIALADAYVERLVFERFRAGVTACDDPSLALVLRQLLALFGLWLLDRDRGWFLEKGYFESVKAGAVREQVNRLLEEIRPHAVPLVDAFGIPDALLAAPIGLR